MSDGTQEASGAFDAERLTALDSDGWAQLLGAVRAVMTGWQQPPPEFSAVLSAPVSRLGAGRGRQQVTALLAGDPVLASRVRQELRQRGQGDLVESSDGTGVGVRQRSSENPAPATATRRGLDGIGAGGGPPVGDVAADDASAAARRAKERVRRLREERDAWRRRAEGAQARISALEGELEQVRAQLGELRTVVDELRTSSDQAARERDRAVERERRRVEGELARVNDELAEHRRDEQRRRAQRRMRAEEQGGRGPRDGGSGPGVDDRRDDGPVVGLVPGRPSRLPSDVARGTTEEASVLLHPGRLVLIDGYNVTRRHRAQLTFEAQRSWLIQLVAQGARARRIRPVVVFDGARASGGRPVTGGREVEVRFSPADITADDEIVLAVEATDEPVLVVTDDRELVARCSSAGADVVGVTPFLGAVTSAP